MWLVLKSVSASDCFQEI